MAEPVRGRGLVWKRWAASVALTVAAVAAPPSTVAAQDDSPYADIPADAYYSVPIRTLAAAGVFAGTLCGDGFCPSRPIDRKTMAVWTVRVLDGADPPAVTKTRFDDVDADSFHASFIERMAELGVTTGCGDGSGFCPDRNVTRAQMAVFLSQAYELPDRPDPEFADVPADAWYAADVARLAASGITAGCGDGTVFCPGRDTTRGQMATFLYTASYDRSDQAGGLTLEELRRVPGPPRNVSIEYVEGHSLTVHWQAPATGGDVTHYEVSLNVPGESFLPLKSPATGRLGHRRNGRPYVADDGSEHYRYVIDYVALDPEAEPGDVANPNYGHDAVRVFAINGEGYAVSEEIKIPSRVSRQHHELRSYVESLVVQHGEAVPWLGDVWTHITKRESTPDSLSHNRITKGFQFRNDYDRLRFHLSGEFRAGHAREDGIAAWYDDEIGPSSVVRVVAHELAHIYLFSPEGLVSHYPEYGTPITFVPQNPFAVTAGYLYLHQLLKSDPSWPQNAHRGGGPCDPNELYADLAAAMVTEQIAGARHRWGGGYWSICRPRGNGSPSEEAIEVARSSLAGQVPQWFDDTYRMADGSWDLDNLWSDVATFFQDHVEGSLYTQNRDFVAYGLLDEFGGYCELAQVLEAASSRSTIVGNPWLDGGCHYAGDGDFTTVSAGGHELGGAYACGLGTDRTIACWGDNSSGRADAPSGTFTAISAGPRHACGLRTDQTIVCWGSNRDGQADAPSGTFTAISVGGGSCGLRTDQRIVCWGDRYYGWGLYDSRSSFGAVSNGVGYTCGLGIDQTIVCWGDNSDGQSDAPPGTFTAVSAGLRHACGVRTDQTIVCWGDNGHGQSDAPPGTFTAVSAATRGSFSCGLRTDQTIVCWGDNSDGQSDAPSGTYTVIDTASRHACGVRTDQTIACWGLRP